MSIRATLVQVVSLDYLEWTAVTELLVNQDLQASLALTACTGRRWVLGGPTSTGCTLMSAFSIGVTAEREKEHRITWGCVGERSFYQEAGQS